MSRVWNFSAGPAALPEEVLRQAAEEMLDWHGSGMGVMEMSHRGKEFTAIAAQAEADLREFLAVPANYRILFMQGGAIAENAIIPMNLMGARRVADYVVTGSWSQKSQKEARKYAEVNIAATAEASGFTTVPRMDEWRISPDPAYVFTCTNETIGGVEYPFEPDLAQIGRGEVPVVADMSSHILSRQIDVSKYGLIFGGAQKNIGPAGLTIVIVREDLLGHAMPHCPTAFDFRTVADNGSMYNTPPTYSIYIAG
ncbi:MAG TPA: 3-phosphoserine/phosphohydroxythreonine transaminase, partial [Thauera sp.]|nr:3-phosphoserine/phosphohydroxythreonine transaminase [Thauera sp.]